MTDIARLGFSADTKALKNARADLEALVPAAKRAEQATDRFNKAAVGITTGSKGAAAGIKSFEAAAAGAASSGDRLSKAALASGTAMGTVQRAAAGAARPLNLLGQSMTRVSAASQMADAHIEAYKASLAGVPAAANGAASSLNRLGAAANDNINRLQSTPGNIAAQFQDIGVTAAGGMSPLLIALQQGTQLSSAMAGGIGNLFAGFRQLFSLTTILTVGLVGLVAAGLQMVDWMAVGETLVMGLADAMEQGAVAATYLGVVLAIAFGPRLLTMVATSSAAIGVGFVGAIKSAAAATLAFAVANPFGLIVLAIGLVIGAMWLLNDTFGGVFTNVLKSVKYVANAIIRFFATAFNAVLKAGDTVVNGLISTFERFSGFLGFDVKVGRVDTSGLQIDTSAGRDFVGDIGTFVQNAASQGAGMLRNAFTGGAEEAAAGGSAGGRTQTSEAEKQAEAYRELVAKARERVAALADEAHALGMSENAARLFRNEQDLLRDAMSAGIKLTTEQREQIALLAQGMSDAEIGVEIRQITNAYKEQMRAISDQADLIGLVGLELEYNRVRQELMNDAIKRGVIDMDNMTEAMRKYVGTLGDMAMTIARGNVGNAGASFMADLTADFAVQNDALERQRYEWALTGAALQAYRIESQLLNDAMRRGIELTPEQITSIRSQAAGYAQLNEQVQRHQDYVDHARQSVRGFFGDMVSNLQQGQSVWQAFGNAVMNVVNRIIDRLLDLGTESILGTLGKLIGGGGLLKTGGLLPSVGGGFDATLAKGGAFTNGVYSDPTVFKFANGGAFGVMGEAGPEAVMPLKRGSDGSLGVQVQSMEPQTVVVRIVTEDERFNAYVDGRVNMKAPDTARAGAVVSQRENAFVASRRLR
jgi:hypothetical protein